MCVFRTSKVFIELVHLQDHVIGDAGLGQQDVQLAGHAASHRVDPEPNTAEEETESSEPLIDKRF